MTKHLHIWRPSTGGAIIRAGAIIVKNTALSVDQIVFLNVGVAGVITVGNIVSI